MNKVLQHPSRFSMQLIAGVSLGLGAMLGSTVAKAETSHYFGRWTVSDDKPVFTKRGILYKTIDVAPCGADFCGVSVSDKGDCGATLFRFLTEHADNDMLEGHGRWGDQKLKLQIEFLDPKTQNPPTTTPGILLGLGDNNFDFEGREGSLAKFQANYKLDGDAKCKIGTTS
ncbi:MAG: hypothetical protein ABJA10_01345 [Aestuariivirga sp.]